jgi:hypothetical protein
VRWTHRDEATAAARRRLGSSGCFGLGRTSDRCRKVIQEYVYPLLDVEISVYEAADGKGVAAIVVREGSSKPYVGVCGTIGCGVVFKLTP